MRKAMSIPDMPMRPFRLTQVNWASPSAISSGGCKPVRNRWFRLNQHHPEGKHFSGWGASPFSFQKEEAQMHGIGSTQDKDIEDWLMYHVSLCMGWIGIAPNPDYQRIAKRLAEQKRIRIYCERIAGGGRISMIKRAKTK